MPDLYGCYQNLRQVVRDLQEHISFEETDIVCNREDIVVIGDDYPQACFEAIVCFREPCALIYWYDGNWSYRLIEPSHPVNI